ncbi:MAG: multi-copper polyphenol oxidoreductase, laccase [Gammaproteobacteria bacterium]|jgi:YfiH family protein|nr:multi-copper polyphenol oxidoreductase, laccase [Gammaproteobacteria bacterium]
MQAACYLKSKWPAPANILAYTTTRLGGNSQPPYDSFNLAEHVGDESATVQLNRQQLNRELALPSEPIWLNQIHSNICMEIDKQSVSNSAADATYTKQPGIICAVLTADCLPILVCNKAGNEVAAIHAGWRGLAAGIVQNTVNYFASPANELLAWLGPAIGPEVFEVGDEVRTQFMSLNPEAAMAFKPSIPGRWIANLYQLAAMILTKAGIAAVYGEPRCTYSNPELFFSYRRESITGRMASLIWFE